MRNVEASGCTLLYDALRRAALELEKVQTRFPDCRLRIMCLTDGNDSGYVFLLCSNRLRLLISA